MSIQKVPATDLQYYLVSYDKDGCERQDDPDGLMSARAEKAVREENITDVFVMSHGWKGDIPAAIEQYDRWIGAMAACEADRKDIRGRRPGFKALLVGFHWPSQPWGEEEFGAGGAGSFALGAGGSGGAIGIAEALDRFVEQYAERIADTPRAREAIRTIVTATMNAGPGTTALPPEVAAAYSVLNEEADIDEREEREPFDPNKAFTNARLSARALGGGAPGIPSFGGFSLSGLLSPLRQISFWKMKDRARKLGEKAGFGLLKGLMAAVPTGRDVRVHLMGHSFGCIVVTSMINGPDGAGVLPQPVNSLMLVQGATSLWGFCIKSDAVNRPGYFRKVIEQNKVSGPIVTTQSKHDTAVGKFYPIAAGVAFQTAFPGQLPKYGGLGAFGIQGEGLMLHDLALGTSRHTYNFEKAHVYNLECTNVIKEGSGASGAHSDIAKPEVAHAMWEAVKVG
ncbi:MAG: hypothetical protein CV088_09395 [Nitrospira sp. LK70]|nr:hypothetical protein [Nitrospira sp. LK70]